MQVETYCVAAQILLCRGREVSFPDTLGVRAYEGGAYAYLVPQLMPCFYLTIKTFSCLPVLITMPRATSDAR
jgi:hypothetical protein